MEDAFEEDLATFLGARKVLRSSIFFLFSNTFEWFVSFPVSLFLVFIFVWLDPTLI